MSATTNDKQQTEAKARFSCDIPASLKQRMDKMQEKYQYMNWSGFVRGQLDMEVERLERLEQLEEKGQA